MRLIDQIRGTDIARFNRACSNIGLAFLVLTIGAKIVRDELKHANNVQDFPQYYMAGLIARSGAWEALYPIPHAGSQINPGMGSDSELRPRARELAISHGVHLLATRFMQPPPTAILLIPLSLVPYRVAWFTWETLLILAAWGIARHAGQIFEICVDRRSHVAGGLMLLVCCSPQAHRWVRVGNMSVIIGWLIGFVVIELVRRDGFRGALAMSIGTLAKYVLGVLIPLYLVMRRWRTIAWGAVFSTALLLVSISISGLQPYRVFAHEIAPTLSRTTLKVENQSLYPVLLRLMNEDSPPLSPAMEIGFKISQWLTLAIVLGLIFSRKKIFWSEPSHVFAGALALLTWLLIFSPICWEHYHAYLAPFWGWLVYQATRSDLKFVLGFAAIGLSFMPISLIIPDLSASLFFALVIMFVMAIAGLVERNSRVADDS